MSRRTEARSTQPRNAQAGSLANDVEQRLTVFAEQMGHMVGAVQNKADGWLESAALQEQLTRVRDGAAELLSDLSSQVRGGAAALTRPRRTATPPKAAARGRSGGEVDAPGKKHRKPPASVRGAKHSDETISKATRARTIRGARRG